ncbi:MAG: hypothetical protein KC713_06445, partial [Candidatus Omnitrophica bacterium]|nr:hypothetical protein [Candidatus Omnitrophota bacterium]
MIKNYPHKLQALLLTFLLAITQTTINSSFIYAQESDDNLTVETIAPDLDAVAEGGEDQDDSQSTDPYSEIQDLITEYQVNFLTEIPSNELVKKAWEASSQLKLERLNQIVQLCFDNNKEEALKQQASLKNFPIRGNEKKYQALNDVATCAFIQAEALMNTGRTDEAIKVFEDIIKTYTWAKAWDPRGWYWSIAEKSQASIEVLTGVFEDKQQDNEVIELIKPQLYTKGTEKILDYTKFGTFEKVGTEKYQFRISDPEGLAAAVGEGIYPNVGGVYDNPRYKQLKEEGRLEGSHWEYVITHDLEAAYFKWATAKEPWGVRLFYIGNIFE